MGINVDSYYQSATSSLKASDLPPGKQARVNIERCEEIGFDENGVTKNKLKLSFVGKEKVLILNKTNAMTIAHVYGGDIDGWIGKEIFLYSTKVDFGGQMVDAIRINVPLQEAAQDDNMNF